MDIWSVRWEGIRITGMSVLVSVHWKSILNKFIEKLNFTDDNFFCFFGVKRLKDGERKSERKKVKKSSLLGTRPCLWPEQHKQISSSRVERCLNIWNKHLHFCNLVFYMKSWERIFFVMFAMQKYGERIENHYRFSSTSHFGDTHN